MGLPHVETGGNQSAASLPFLGEFTQVLCGNSQELLRVYSQLYGHLRGWQASRRAEEGLK